jgi:ABC-type bacteriocin/lantibiotic exporter with double-glycine peptidase domain
MSGEYEPWLPVEGKLVATSLILAVILLVILWWISTQLLAPVVPSIVAVSGRRSTKILPRLSRRARDKK